MIEEIIKNARLTSSGRKLLTSEQKAYIVEAWEDSKMTCPEFCRRFGLITSQLYHWRKNAKRGAIMSIKNDGELHSKAELEALRYENPKKKVGNGSTTKQEVKALASEFSASLNRTIKALGINRSSVFYVKTGYPKSRTTSLKPISKTTKDAIIDLTGRKSTYGVPRVKAILKRDYGVEESKYMIHRFMKEEGLLITRDRKRGSSRPHTGRVSVDEINTRWASDITSIKCWNGQKVRFTFIMDCCDRSIIAWKAGLKMQACDIELMLQDALFNRFGEKLPQPNQLEFLHDNGPEYIEKQLRNQMEKWNVIDCNTPTYSPQSNGMCESLNGTLKRDYVYESCLDNPETVIAQIQNWVDEYNSFAPHSSLNMKTPKEYFNFKNAA